PDHLLELPSAAAGLEDSLSWNRVVVDKTQRLLVVFCRVPDRKEKLLGFAARPEGWALHGAEPIIRLESEVELFQEVNPSLDAWRQAWQSWSQVRGVTPVDAAACVLTLSQECLRVAAPANLIRQFQAAKIDVLKGETWIMGGDGFVRPAARLVLVSLRAGTGSV